MLTKLECGIWVREENYKADFDVVNEVVLTDCYRLTSEKIFPIIRSAQNVIDIGAHIGCFTYRIHLLNQTAKITCVEVCPENIDLLTYNVGEYARVIQAACLYGCEDIWLFNSVFNQSSVATGGSKVIGIGKQNEVKDWKNDYRYWKDDRKIPTITLEEIAGTQVVDVLKLDCEGCEYNILLNTTILDQVRCIVGEYHTRKNWLHFLKNPKLRNWEYIEISEPLEIGQFHLLNRSIL